MIYRLIVGILVAGWLPCALDESVAHASDSSSSILEVEGKGLLKDVEDMVVHGGMGDAKAIVHHCEEAVRHAEKIIEQLSGPDTDGHPALASLHEVIRQCRRVSAIGAHADPGFLLNPAMKARAAARESVKSLQSMKAIKG